MRSYVQMALGLGIVSLLFGGPIGYISYREKNFRNFRTVRPDVLYRSGQLSPDGLERIVHDYGIRTVITLRDSDTPGKRPPDWREEEFCRKMDIYHYRLPPRLWWSESGAIPADENVKKLLEVLDNPKHYPVLIHCFAGAHRTGAYCAIFRMEYDHWDNQAALDELQQCGYDHLYSEWDVLGYLRNYVPRWKRNAVKSEASGSH